MFYLSSSSPPQVEIAIISTAQNIHEKYQKIVYQFWFIKSCYGVLRSRNESAIVWPEIELTYYIYRWLGAVDALYLPWVSFTSEYILQTYVFILADAFILLNQSPQNVLLYQLLAWNWSFAAWATVCNYLLVVRTITELFTVIRKWCAIAKQTGVSNFCLDYIPSTESQFLAKSHYFIPNRAYFCALLYTMAVFSQVTSSFMYAWLVWWCTLLGVIFPYIHQF